jgi:PAS domain S-box-containing protein
MTEHLRSELRRSQAYLRGVIDGMPGLVAYVDRSYTYLFVNAGYSKWMGRPVEELEGTRIVELLGPEAMREEEPWLERAFAGEQVCFERRLPCVDMVREVRVQYAPQRGPGGEVEGVISLVMDITEQKHSESMFRRIVEMASEGIWMVDPEGATTFVNPRMQELLGCEEKDFIGRRWYEFIHPDDRERGLKGFAQRKQGDRAPREFRMVRADGSPVWLDFTGTTIRDAAGALTGVLAMCTDITERKLAQEQVQQTQKLESLGVLAGGIAHDFNNLLVGILGNASLAADLVEGSSPAQAMLADLTAAAERAAKLTRQLLAYAGRDQRRIGAVSLDTVVSELIPLLHASIPRTVNLQLRLEGGLPLVEGDEGQIQQIVMNLVINAAESIAEGKPGLVSVSTEQRQPSVSEQQRAVIPMAAGDGKYVVLTVADSGCGMDSATQARIFDPFFTTKFAGRGLGLSAVLGIIKAHGGTLILETAPGKGTTFRVFFRASVRKPTVPVVVEKAPETSTGTILVVDDEATVRNLARRTLEFSGYDVIAVNDGAQAIEAVMRHPEIEAVLLDLAMPNMTGDQAAPEIRKARPGIRILLSSGYAEQEARERFRDVRLDGFLQKPYTARALVRGLRAALRGE